MGDSTGKPGTPANEQRLEGKIAVAIPCYNEAVTIAKVVRDFQAVLPQAEIHVFDNNSTDGSPELAQQAGATVHFVRRQGKGNVMCAIFESLDCDALVVADGDDTYFAEDAPKLIAPVLSGEADMVTGNRLGSATSETMVPLHQFGNNLIVAAVNRLFTTDYKDILSGYRVFSRRFIESVPVLTSGFEVETEITLQALEERLLIVELPISYRSRPEGSISKLRTFRDGYRIMLTAAIILRDHQPLRLFGLVGLICFLVALTAGILRLLNYLSVTQLPDALLTGILLLSAPIAVITFGIGLMLNTVNTRFREIKQIMLRNKPPNAS